MFLEVYGNNVDVFTIILLNLMINYYKQYDINAWHQPTDFESNITDVFKYRPLS